jgi:PAP2 superfamily
MIRRVTPRNHHGCQQFVVSKENSMALFRVQPTRTDKIIADAVSEYTTPTAERAAEVLTWGADEHVLCALALGWWLYSRNKDGRRRRDSNHILLTTIATAILPHVLKMMFTQERPDRRIAGSHLHGVPFSGKPLDSFPSGHAIHVGAIASAATALPPAKRNVVWAIGGGLVLTRVVLLAHWLSDVVAGLAIGALIERLLRLITSYGTDRGDAETSPIRLRSPPRPLPTPAGRGYPAPNAPR